jgi:hypothetical protein
MADRNQLTLVGRIGGAFKEGKTKNGEPYIYFSFDLQSKQTQNSTENNQDQHLHIMCFRKQVIEYLRRVKAHTGNVAIIFGFVSAFKDEVKGKDVIVNAINCHECYIVKTKADN